jgi:hypothetical protein
MEKADTKAVEEVDITEEAKNADNTVTNHSDKEREQPGQRFHMDMGFVRGTKYTQ